ncbi:peptidoglycan recognition protein family protein [Nocardioides aurantiacus]|uniref:peptidoglycan recognition protein family protein n=1 Tax=Nocardioides aurantiacus TaxID=86796 RepID=UPI001477245B|nr:N-acetylmuramoyl-L-alanine amidase [Nocardioides aurantiacus]
MTLTEIGGLTDLELRKLANGWPFFRGANVPGVDECAILWHPSLTAAAPGYVQKISDLQYQQADADWVPKVHAAVQPLRFPDGQVVTFITLHAALRNTPRRVKVSDDGLRFLGAWLPTIAGPKVVMADWNLGYRVAAHRAALERLSNATGMTWAWQDNVEGFDTKKSLIDGVLTDLPVRESTLLPAIASSDHWPVRVDLTLPDSAPLPTPPQEAPVARLPIDLPTTLRKAGLKVQVHGNDWQARGRPGSFNPVGVLCHHTATSKRTSDGATIQLLIDGRPDLPGPLCQLGLSRDGTVHVIAGGRTNHGGKAKSSGTVSAGDANSLYIGIEAFNDGVGEPWPKEQVDAYVLLAATLCKKVTGNSAETVRGHKETSVTGKIDPTFSMPDFRKRVAAAISSGPTKPFSPSKEAPVVKLNGVQIFQREALALVDKHAPAIIAARSKQAGKGVGARAYFALLRTTIKGFK